MEDVARFDELYDDATLARLDAGGPGRGARPVAVTTWRSRAAAGALVAALGRGLADTYDPAPRRPRIVELDPGDDESGPGPVTVHLVPGDPPASVVVVRPWLLASLRS